MRKVRGLCLVHPEIEIIDTVGRAGLRAGIASHALVIHISRIELDSHIEVAFLTLDVFHFCKGIERNVRAVLNTLELYLKAAVRGTEFPEVFIDL